MNEPTLLSQQAKITADALVKYHNKQNRILKYERRLGIPHAHEVVGKCKVLREAREWYTESVVMLVHRSTCNCCGNVSSLPERELLVKTVNARKGITILSSKPLGLIPPHIQRTIKYLDKKPTTSCEQCFTGAEAENQLDLFDPRKEYPTHSEYLDDVGEETKKDLDQYTLDEL